MIKELDKLAMLLFSEFGFNTCTEEEQEIILKEYIKRIKNEEN
jgi:hypothetical protein